MTTAHRPTFDPARGKDAQRGPAYHQRLLPAHKTLKYRQAAQGTEAETARRDLRAELLRAERRHYAKKEGRDVSDDEEAEPTAQAAIAAPEAVEDDAEDSSTEHGRKRSLDESRGGNGEGDGEEESYAAKRTRVLAETAAIDASSESEDGSDSDSDSSSSDEDDDDDEEALLMAELAKIKRERAEAAAKAAAEQAEKDEEKREREIALGNPLLQPEGHGGDYGVKRRWDDDVVFKNQARGVGEKEKARGKEFVNDMLRSDFHRKFMSRYVR
ncbi:Cwf15/Cwc15 cell cycle control protein [Myriangium duriaei CBS 260.36]|uniref:Cwf15/Cwc15 cell cycle control protein n=1 Tax=Myriangium duriaei CBS 260.36 TaxID=1168546 RepID=A0A9P4IZB3_9PEZI|nr:Cwf15/Cwc15 cell cycle control protein [Myriangium duriaei CBS 260.36]